MRRPAGPGSRAARGAAGALVLAGALVVPAAHAQEPPATGVRVLPTGGLSMEAAALLLSGQQGGTLPLAVLATPLEATPGGVRVAVVVEVAGPPLLARHTGEGPLWLDLALYVVGGDGAVLASLLETMQLDLATWRERLADGGVKVVRSLELPPGSHSLRALVRHPPSREVGLSVGPLVVPDPSGGTPALRAPVFVEDADPWVASAPGPSPAAWGGGLPAARPVLVLGGTVTLRLQVPRALAGGPLEVELDPSGGGSIRLPATTAPDGAAAPPGLVALAVEFQPAGAPAGDAALRVVTAGGEAASLRVPVVVAAEGSGGSSWVTLATAGRGPERGAADKARVRAPEASHPRPSVPRRQRAAAYRRALLPLAEQDGARAREELTAFDAGLLSSGVLPEELSATELDVLGALSAAEAEAVLPVLWHYLELYREQVGGSPLLASHAREMVYRLADLYAASASAPGAGELAATALGAHVATLPPDASRQFLARALRHALDLHPQDRLALLCSAIDAARHGDHDLAVERLEALRRLEPGEPEVLLRLAHSRARLGERRRARALLTELLETPAAAETPPPWWLPLAYQELAQVLVEDDRAAAERVLRRGLARLPGEEKLSLQLALLLGERGDRARAAGVLADVRPAPDDRGYDSARHRFPQLPAEPLQRAAAEVRSRAEAARTRLAAALQGAPSDGRAR